MISQDKYGAANSRRTVANLFSRLGQMVAFGGFEAWTLLRLPLALLRHVYANTYGTYPEGRVERSLIDQTELIMPS